MHIICVCMYVCTCVCVCVCVCVCTYYAKTVPLYPHMHESMIGRPIAENTSSCSEASNSQHQKRKRDNIHSNQIKTTRMLIKQQYHIDTAYRVHTFWVDTLIYTCKYCLLLLYDEWPITIHVVMVPIK